MSNFLRNVLPEIVKIPPQYMLQILPHQIRKSIFASRTAMTHVSEPDVILDSFLTFNISPTTLGCHQSLLITL